jgi:hypothetical protein
MAKDRLTEVKQDKPVKDNRAGKPFKRTLNGVMKAVSENPKVNRKGIIDITEYSNHCVDRCLDCLLENGDLKRSFVRMSGPYKVYDYELNANKDVSNKE